MSLAQEVYEANRELVQIFKACEPHEKMSADASSLYPTEYCAAWWLRYLEIAARRNCILIVGMNPSPSDMGQTGIAFTDQPTMRDLFDPRGLLLASCHGLQAAPPSKYGKFRFGNGLGNLTEESGQRMWKLLRELVATGGLFPMRPRLVTERFLFVNACPVLWITRNGSNVSAADKRVTLESRCMVAMHTWLKSLRDILQPTKILAAGDWAATRCKNALGPQGFVKIRHPSGMAGSEETWREAVEMTLRTALEEQLHAAPAV